MVVAGKALLITMNSDDCLPVEFVGNVAKNLRGFMLKRQIPAAEIEEITLSTYDDHEK